MSHDLVLRGGTVVDGTGTPGVRADVAVDGDRITEVGEVSERGTVELDAEGRAITPGFVDGHTHMDAQIFWDPLGTCSSWNGITTAVMGNCGFTLAPANLEQRPLVVRNLERAEDISGDAMAAGIEWSWDTFRSYLDTVERLPKGINYACQIGHSALRTWVMGERAFEEHASDDDLAAMARELRDALDAGAIGFTTSTSAAHVTADDRPVASRSADWSEIAALVGVMGERGGGLFEFASDGPLDHDPDARRAWRDAYGKLALDSPITLTFGVFSGARDEAPWREVLQFLDEINAAGGRAFGQSHSREIAVLMSFRTRMPFDRLPEWSEIRGLSLDEQRRALTNPETRARLVAAARDGDYGRAMSGGDLRRPNYDRIRVLHRGTTGNPSVAEEAARRGVDPVDAIIDLALETDFHQFFGQANVNSNLDFVLEILQHPRNVMTFSDSGAHVSQIMDSSIQTNLLAYWVRERGAFTFEEAIRMITSAPARAWGFTDRGVVRPGMVADLNVIDPGRVEPQLPTIVHDLPAGAMRLVQKSDGIDATIVGGEILFSGGEHTGALPGRLLRRR